MSLPSVLCIAGPTASGKSGLAHRLARHIGGEILSADAVAVFRGFRIGSAMPSDQERREVRYHLVDCLEPTADFTSARFRDRGLAIARDCQTRGVPLIVAGGTGLYLRHLLYGLIDAPPGDPELRAQIEAQEAATPGATLARLQQLDPAAAERIDRQNLRYLTRAVEVCLLTGRRWSAMHDEHRFSKPASVRARLLVLRRPRPELYARVNARVDQMMELGLLAEVRGLLDAGVPRDCRPMGALGYRQMTAHLLDGLPLAEAIRLTKRDTRHFAKRQINWFKREQGVEALDVDPRLEARVQTIAKAHFGL